MPQATPFEQFQQFLREMFQYDNNDLDFGLFKVLRLKRNYIEQFITGDDEQDLKRIVQRELAAIRSRDSEDEKEMLGRYLDDLGRRTREAWAALLPEPNDAEKQTRLKQAVAALEDSERLAATQQRLEHWLLTQKYSIGHLEAQLYNYLLNFFELYYQNGDFGYNSRASQAFRVPYEADYDGADTLFHWKHKDSYYIKTGASFPEVKLDLLGRKIVFRLQAGGDAAAEATAQNNNKESDIKHYRLAGIEPDADACVLRFTLAAAGTPKADIYRQLWQTAYAEGDGRPAFITPYLLDKDNKSLFNDLGRDHDKAEGGQIKGINQLRLSWDKYLEALAKQEAFKTLGSNGEKRAEAIEQDPVAQALHALDRALNRFYVGQDADYFIHKDLHGFLTREKDRFIKNVIFSDLATLLDRQVEPATLIIARGFNAVAGRIIEFLDVLETFQRNLFTLKKKVVDTHWLISVGKIAASYYPRLIANPRLIDYWAGEFKCAVASVDDVAAHPPLVLDTSLFTSPEECALIEEILGGFDHLDEATDGLLIHSENWQALNLLQDKFRERIQCIYIDPPYNTGGDGFLYKDSFRHSSWASMMEDRVRAARPLLALDGAFLSSVDDNEATHLRHVLDQAFGADNFLCAFAWIKRYAPPPDTKDIGYVHESILGYRNGPSWCRNLLPLTGEQQARYKNPDKDERGAWKAMDYTCRYTADERPNLYYPIIQPNTGEEIWPKRTRVWAYSKAEHEKNVQEARIWWGLNGINNVPALKNFLTDIEQGFMPTSLLHYDLAGHTDEASKELRSLFPGIKHTPKPTRLIATLAQVFSKPGGIFLDFFAGTGTTAHACIAANKLRVANIPPSKFILVEMGDYFDTVLKPRVARIMHSLNWDNGQPKDRDGYQGLVKVQRLEQYEDVLANLNTAWNEATLPDGLPVSYLFRPEQNCIQLGLNLKRPFDNRLRVGKTLEERTLDLLESWAYLQGYWQRSRRVFHEAGRRYECLETECGTLVLLRDIAEPADDSAALAAIVARYADTDAAGHTTPRLRRLEVNHWVNLVRLEAVLPGLPCAILQPQDFDRGAEWV